MNEFWIIYIYYDTIGGKKTQPKKEALYYAIEILTGVLHLSFCNKTCSNVIYV